MKKIVGIEGMSCSHCAKKVEDAFYGLPETEDIKIEITKTKIIPGGETGNEYGDKPVIAFWYKTTNKTDKKVSAVEEYEKEQNSEEVKRQVSKNREIEAIVYKTKDPILVTRTYFFYTRGGEYPAPKEMVGSVEQYSLSFSQPNLGIWQHGREWFITREVKVLTNANQK